MTARVRPMCRSLRGPKESDFRFFANVSVVQKLYKSVYVTGETLKIDCGVQAYHKTCTYFHVSGLKNDCTIIDARGLCTKRQLIIFMLRFFLLFAHTIPLCYQPFDYNVLRAAAEIAAIAVMVFELLLC